MIDFGHSHQRDVVWTNHALHRIEQSGGELEYMSELLKKSPEITLSLKDRRKKRKYGADQQSFHYYWDATERTLFTCRKQNGKLYVITVTQK